MKVSTSGKSVQQIEKLTWNISYIPCAPLMVSIKTILVLTCMQKGEEQRPLDAEALNIFPAYYVSLEETAPTAKWTRIFRPPLWLCDNERSTNYHQQ